MTLFSTSESHLDSYHRREIELLIMLALPHNLLLRQQFIILISFLSSMKRQPGKHVIIPLPRNHGDLFETNNLDIRSSVPSIGKVCHGSMSSSSMLCILLYKNGKHLLNLTELICNRRQLTPFQTSTKYVHVLKVHTSKL